MTTFTRIATGMAIVEILEAQVIGDAPGHPISTTFNVSPNLSDIACAAGPNWSLIILMRSESPTKPTPIINPEWIAFPTLIPIQILMIAITIGSITEAPMSITY